MAAGRGASRFGDVGKDFTVAKVRWYFVVLAAAAGIACGQAATPTAPSSVIAAGNGPVDMRLHSMLVERVTYRLSAVQHYTQSLDDLLSAIRPMLLARRLRHFAREAERFERVLNEGPQDRGLRAGACANDRARPDRAAAVQPQPAGAGGLGRSPAPCRRDCRPARRRAMRLAP